MTNREFLVAVLSDENLDPFDNGADGKEYPRSEQVKRYGNAVCPPIQTALVRANLPEICEEAIV